MDELDRRSIVYRTQHVIARWLIDITIPEHRIAIEADGTYWHSSLKQKTKDANKTHWLQAHKWAVFRFPETEIRASASDCIDRVVECMVTSL
jgi:very-short-patch-repair endonuclease